MRSRAIFGLALAASLSATSAAGAQMRTEDPEGKREYFAALSKGEGAFVAKDIPGAIAAFQDAVKVDPSRMLAFYRLGEAQRAAGKPEDADATWQTALTKKGTPLLKAKVLFIIAEGRERMHKLQAAKDGWKAYVAFIATSAEAKGYQNVAEQHIKVIDRRMKDEVDYAAVKERIEKRKKEVEAEAVENAKKDKLNR
jgi:tetratricopeptide (TPR) repeat protein